jgi:ribosomal-protein-alanine N-acetyltransferase
VPRLIIREIRENDLPAILEIEKVSFSSALSGESFMFELPRKFSIALVAVYRKKVIGYLCADYKGHEARILNLAVHSEFRRRSVATLLMNETERRLKKRGCVFVYLKVRPSNNGAQRFYESLGFRVETVRKNYYGDPDEDALQMIGRL